MSLSVSAAIPAPPNVVYGIIADYNVGHPEILPKPPFVSLTVEQGGVGAGTVIKVQMMAMKRLASFRAVVTEPEPGRRLVETNDTGYVTDFLVEPRDDGRSSYVTISTKFPGRSGLLGVLERWFISRMLRPVYKRELDLLKAAAAAAGTGGGAGTRGP